MNKNILNKGVKNIYHLFTDQKPSLLLRTVINYIQALFKIPKSTLPLQVQIEPSAACNLKCLMCNLDKSNETEKFLTPARLRKIIKELKTLKSINFTGMGESLLNPHFTNLIRIANQNRIEVSFITNAQLLTPQLTQQLLSLKISSVSISIESGDPKTYEKIRLGAKFEILKKNLAYLMQYRQQIQSPTEIVFNTVFLKTNLDDIRHIFKIIDLAQSLKIKRLTFQNPHSLESENIKDYYTTKKTLLLSKLDKIKKYADSKNIEITLPQTNINNGSCYYPWIYPQITASGDVLPCCIIPQFGPYSQTIRQFSFGNIELQKFPRIWNNTKASFFRKNLKNNHLDVCKNCTKNQGIL